MHQLGAGTSLNVVCPKIGNHFTLRGLKVQKKGPIDPSNTQLCLLTHFPKFNLLFLFVDKKKKRKEKGFYFYWIEEMFLFFWSNGIHQRDGVS